MFFTKIDTVFSNRSVNYDTSYYDYNIFDRFNLYHSTYSKWDSFYFIDISLIYDKYPMELLSSPTWKDTSQVSYSLTGGTYSICDNCLASSIFWLSLLGWSARRSHPCTFNYVPAS